MAEGGERKARPPARINTSTRRSPKEVEDANPLNRRVEAQVTSRRIHAVVAVAQEMDEIFEVDPKRVLALRPDGRAKWLWKALQQASDGRCYASDLYDVIADTRLGQDLTEKCGRKMARALRENFKLFSKKQQRFIKDESVLARYFKAPDDKGDDQKQDFSVAKMEEMMARCRDFVRVQQLARGERDENELEPDEAAEGNSAVSGAVPEAHLADGQSRREENATAKEKKEKDASPASRSSKGGSPSKDKKKASRSRSKSSSKSSSSGGKRKRSSSSSASRKKAKRKKEKAKSKKDKKKKAASSDSSSKRSSSSSPPRKKKRSRSSSSSSKSSSSASDRKKSSKKKKK